MKQVDPRAYERWQRAKAEEYAAQQQASAGEVPEWAIERARALTMKEFGRGDYAITAFARYIAAHEQPPVDPLDEIMAALAHEYPLPEWDGWNVLAAEFLRQSLPGIDELARVTVAKGGE